MESWSASLWALWGRDDAMPYFSRISKKASLQELLFNGQRSIEAIPRSSLPFPFRRHDPFPERLPDAGQISSGPVEGKRVQTFFITGKTRFRGFNSLVKQTGIERYISRKR
jgi:hypothetical protein